METSNRGQSSAAEWLEKVAEAVVQKKVTQMLGKSKEPSCYLF